jgi:uncharacterized protein (TIGR02996 family)
MPRRARPELLPPRPQVFAFLRAIKESPEDDTPRLIFADWLEEQGDPRGEFLRLQCALARLGEDDPDEAPLAKRNPDRAPLLAKRERELRQRHQAQWLGPLRELVTAGYRGDYRHSGRFDFRRGLVKIHVKAKVFLSATFRKCRTTEAYAWVDELRLTNVTTRALADLVASPYLGDIITRGDIIILDLHGIGAAGAAALAASPHLARLTSLDLVYNAIGDAGAAALAASPHLANLTSLRLYANDDIRRRSAGAKALRRRFGNRVAL